jgi:predicted transcriptional regulator
VSKRKITEADVRQAWAEVLGPVQPVIPEAGWTVAELAEKSGFSERTVARRLRAAIKAGKARQIGVRPAPSRAAVFIITSGAKNVQ